MGIDIMIGNRIGAYRKEDGFAQSIKEAMVLWYDIAKQGATNESMAENPVLRDLSGNGHDATCYNFAWKGMSGVDGRLLIIGDTVVDNENIKYVQTDGRCNITYIGESQKNINIYINFNQNSYTDTFVIKNIPNGATINFKASIGYHLQVTQDGIYTIDVTDGVLGIAVNNFVGECNIIIEELGLYPHALVSDGIDDYCLVEGLPNIHSLFIKYSRLGQASTSWRYLYNTEINGAEDTDRWYCATAPNSGMLVSVPSISDVGYAQKVNDIVTDNRFFEIFRYHGGGYGTFALYSLILFNRDLTPEEIEWVKTNLIEQ